MNYDTILVIFLSGIIVGLLVLTAKQYSTIKELLMVIKSISCNRNEILRIIGIELDENK